MPTPAEIARRALADHLAALPPAELLKRYAARRDPEAFAGLVQQFGPMVLGVCRRVLGASPDVDDAFQAVFLSLARQADSFRDAKALPAWLHRVSLRVAHKALARRAPASEPAEAVADPADPLADVAWKDLRRVLDEELDALPEKYRGPVVLCWLDGLTQDEAAGRLGMSLATLKRRLEAGRELLRARLTTRGLAPVVVTAVVTDPIGLRAVVPETLSLLAVELGIGGVVPERIGALEVVTPPTGSTRRAALATLLGVGTAAAGGLAYALSRPPRPPEPAIPLPQPEPKPVAVAPAPRPVLGPLQFESKGQPLSLHPQRWVKSVVFSRDGRTVISDGEHAPRVWDVKTRVPRDYSPPNEFARSWDYWSDILVGPDGRSVVTGIDNTVQFLLYDYVHQVCRYGALGNPKAEWEPTALALSPDGNTLATSSDAALRLWDASRWWKLPEVVLGKEPERPDWTLRDPRVLSAPRRPGDPPFMFSLAFSPDG